MTTTTSRAWPDTVPRRAALKAIGGGVAAHLLAACGGPRGDTTPVSTTGANADDLSARFAGYAVAPERNRDLEKVAWPAFITKAGPEVQQLYAFQIEHGDLMRYMPCFCGCNKEDGHRNNRDCYIETITPDGAIVFDTMAPT